ncbi:MAG: F0F1 ATP synthase subunit B [Tissierellia bacterium]|nr:F0F1 ATP synthase subunit B [Tissierellia bacterium]
MGEIDIVVRVLPELSSVLISWATLLVLYLLLRKLLYKPVSKILSDRQAKIQSNIEEAKQLREEAEKLKLDYEARIADAKKESQDIIESARKRGEELRENIVEEARKEAELLMDRARKTIEQEKEKAFEDIKAQVGELAILIASNIMEEEINPAKQEELIHKFIDEVGSSQWLN